MKKNSFIIILLTLISLNSTTYAQSAVRRGTFSNIDKGIIVAGAVVLIAIGGVAAIAAGSGTGSHPNNNH